jgi:transcriptional regulator with XRE-family HTH domain
MIKERLQALMDEKGWSVTDLAYHAKVSDASIYNILNGVDARMSTVARLAQALDVPMSALIDEDQVREFLEGLKIKNGTPSAVAA